MFRIACTDPGGTTLVVGPDCAITVVVVGVLVVVAVIRMGPGDRIDDRGGGGIVDGAAPLVGCWDWSVCPSLPAGAEPFELAVPVLASALDAVVDDLGARALPEDGSISPRLRRGPDCEVVDAVFAAPDMADAAPNDRDLGKP